MEEQALVNISADPFKNIREIIRPLDVQKRKITKLKK
jgi:hypothetical protein